MPIRAERAGTKAPICARIRISAFCRRNVLLPAMLGPVTSQIRSSPRTQSLAMKLPLPASAASTVGWRPPRISKAVPDTMSGRTQPLSAAHSAWPAARSSAASAAAAPGHDFADQIFEQPQFEREGAVGGAGDAAFELAQFDRGIALRSRHGLAM